LKSIFFTFLFCAFVPLTAQKKVAKSILKESIKLIQIDANNCFSVVLETTKSNTIVIEAQMDGEYSDELYLNLVENGNTLQVNSGFGPNHINPNDKLSAHKVVSIALKVFIPRHKNVQVNGTSTNVFANGVYNNLQISVSDGLCTLKEIKGNLIVKTQTGNILVTSNNAKINAISKYGTVAKNLMDNNGNNLYELSTVSGNIIVNKTK
jgi:hypothetical protein